MKSKQFLKEGFVEDAQEAQMDHEVQMARVDCYYAAEHAMVLHKLLRNISEEQGLEGWVASKITLANDYLKSVREHLEYQMMSADADESDFLPIAEGLNPVKKNKINESDDNRDMNDFERGPWYIILKGSPVSENGSPKKFNWLNGAKTFFRTIMDEDPKMAEKIKQEYEAASDKKSIIYYSKKLPTTSSQEETPTMEASNKPGLWANIRAKRERIKSGSGERMRAPGSKGAPSDKDLKSIRASSVKEGWQDEFADMVGQMKKSGRLGMPKSNYNFKTPEPKSKEELMSRLKELEAEFDPAYQQSDDYSFWKKQNDIASEISSIRRQLRQQGVAEAKSPQEFMAQISKSDSSILTNKKESPYYAAGKMLSKYADKIGQDSMDFADFKQHAALLMGGPEANMKSAKQVRNLDTAASDIILDMIWEYSTTQKDADTYFKISGFKRLREGTKSTTVGVAEASFTAAASMNAANRKQSGGKTAQPTHGIRVGDKVTTNDGKKGEVTFVNGDTVHVNVTNHYYPHKIKHYSAKDLKKGVTEGQEDLEEATSMKQQWKNDVKQVHGNNVRFEVEKAVRSNEETQSAAYDENGNKVAYFYHKSGRQNILPKPKVKEDLSKTNIKKQISKFEELALAANRAGDDEKSKQYQRKIQSLKQKMSQDVTGGLSDVVKGVKRKISGKKDPKEVAHTYARIARRDIEDANKLNNQAAYDARDKSTKRWEKVNKVVNKEGVAEGIKGWKHAHSDMMKHRAESGKDVHLVSLKKDGTESKMHDAKKSFKSEEEARAHHKRVKELNPNRTIAHNLYVGGKVEKLS
jgi:preprotein translocase subunit YajC